jgi:hypothetical protein
MNPVSSTNLGLTNLLQTLSNIGSPVLSSPAVTSALQSASPSDIVQLSAAATQLENMEVLFGQSDGSAPTTDPLTALQNLVTGSAAAAATSSTATASSSANQLANYQADLQLAESQGLFGSPASSSSGSLVNVTA